MTVLTVETAELKITTHANTFLIETDATGITLMRKDVDCEAGWETVFSSKDPTYVQELIDVMTKGLNLLEKDILNN